MLVRGSATAINTLLLYSNQTKARFAGGHGPWATPPMDARFLTRPLGGTVSNGLESLYGSGGDSFYTDGSGDLFGGGDYYDQRSELGGFEQVFNEGDFTLQQDFIEFGGGVGTVPVTVLTNIAVDGLNVVGTLTPMLVQQVFPSAVVPLIPLREGCCNDGES